MIGYKALDKNLINRTGTYFEIGKKYIVKDNNIKWGSNGFHFCTNIEDTLRYVDTENDNYSIVEVSSNGNMIMHEDDYYGYYDMYVSDEIEILRQISREELFNIVYTSNNVQRMQRLITSIKLTLEEINLVKEKYPSLTLFINYYQNNDKLAFERKLKLD